MALTGFNHSIRWNQFREVSRRPANVSEDAEIQVNFSLNYRSRAPANQDCAVTSVNTGLTINRARSWVVRGKKTVELLSHEQGHYDITALGARELFQQVSALTADQCPEIDNLTQQIRTRIQRLINQTNRRYDTRTSHGTNRPAQQVWESNIRRVKQNTAGTLSDL